MEEYHKKIEALKTPRGRVPSPPTAQQVARINKVINTTANNSPSPNKSPAKKKNSPSPSPLSASHVYPAVAGLKAKSKKKVQWWNQ
jgi:hypothetical protein